LRVPLLRAREFNAHDDATGPLVAMVNQTLAHRFWPNQYAIGKKVTVGTLVNAEVVGVIGDVKNLSLAELTNPEVFLPFPQLPWAHLNLSVRTATDPARLGPSVRAEIAKIDQDQPVNGIQTMQEVLEASAADRTLGSCCCSAASW
jgi:putative ABC transport system permease protein